MRVVIFGGRDFSDQSFLFRRLDEIDHERDITLVISGMAQGADSLAISWACKWDIPVMFFPANWKKYGRSAGWIRNQQMIDDGKPDFGVALPGGKGTADMIERLHKARIEVITA